MAETCSAARCDTCRHFDPLFVPVDCVDDEEDALGLCGYPRDHLPLSEQGVPSNRRAVGPHETGCPTHEPIAAHG